MSDISLELFQELHVKARGSSKSVNKSYGIFGGEGAKQLLELIKTEKEDPAWVDESDQGRGRWVESVVYAVHLTLKCPTPVDSRLIKTKVWLPESPYRYGLTDSYTETD